VPFAFPVRWRSAVRPFLILGVLLGGLLATSVVRGQAASEKPTSAEGSEPVPEALNFANGLFRDRHYAQAAAEYERFLKTNPPPAQAAEARFGLANALLFLGKYPAARKQFEDFLDQAPEHTNAPTALFRVGETAYLMGDLPAARKALESFTADHPGHRLQETAWPYLGDVCRRLGDLPAARRAYEQALTDHVQGRLVDRARYGLGQTLAALKETEAALKVFEELASGGSADWSDKARFRVGQIQAEAGHFAEAVAAFEALERDHPRSPLVPEARLRRAEALARLGQHAEAEALLRPLLADASPTLVTQAAYALGVAQLERGQTAEGLATLDAAYRRFPRAPLAPALLFQTAEAALRQGKPNDARARFLKLAETYPKDPWADDALYQAARLALQAHDFNAAKTQAAALVTRFPDSPLRAEARLIEARAALDAGQPKVAIALLQTMLTADKPSPATTEAARYTLGLAYRADGQADKAAEILDALAKTPSALTSTDAQFLVGQAHFEAKRFAAAIAPLEQYLAAKSNGDVADHALAYLAQARAELGQTDAALATLGQLVNRFPKSKVLAPTRLNLAETLYNAKQYDRAASLFRKAAETDDPKLQTRALSGLGWSLLQSGKPADAAAAFRDRLKIAVDDPTASEDALALARALEAGGQTDEALAAFAWVARQFAQSDQAGPALLARARLLVKTKHPEEAARAFAAYVEHPPKGQTDSLDTALAEWAWALLDADKVAEADEVFARLLRDFPKSPRAADARLNLAESAYQAQKYDEVIRLLEPVVAETSKVEPVLLQSALYRLGRTDVERKDWPAAARLFDRLITDYPNSTFCREARFWRAEVAFQQDDTKTAEALFAALIADTPANASGPEPWIRTAKLREVQCLVLLGRWKEALAHADALEAEAPDLPQKAEIDYARGRALQGLARFDDARAAYQAVIDARKGGELAAKAQLMRGETYFHQKNYPEALREFLKVDLNHNAPKWQALGLLQAGKVYEQLAQWSDAALTYQKLLEKFPKDPNAAEATRRLRLAQQKALVPDESATGAGAEAP
jgi:TolA-binding protein